MTNLVLFQKKRIICTLNATIFKWLIFTNDYAACSNGLLESATYPWKNPILLQKQALRIRRSYLLFALLGEILVKLVQSRFLAMKRLQLADFNGLSFTICSKCLDIKSAVLWV